MVQQQLLEAARRMAATGAAPAGPDKQRRDPEIAQLSIAAMIAAKEDGCPCRAAQFLRKQSDLIMTAMWKSVAEVAGAEEAPDTAPPAIRSEGGAVDAPGANTPPAAS